LRSAQHFRHGLLTITAQSTIVAVGDPVASAKDCVARIEAAKDSQIVLLPELTLGGYTCGDLFGTASFLEAVGEGADLIRQATGRSGQLAVFGAPLLVQGALMNTAVVAADGRILGIVPKQFLPTYREFYERRHFRAADGSESSQIDWLDQHDIPLGIDLLFRWRDAVIGIEICEDLWVPVPPSSLMAMAGANVLLNLSASNETIGKANWRRDLVASQSGRCIAAYAYASAGPTESTTDLVFGGHCLIAENGVIVGQSRHVGDSDQPLDGPTGVTAQVDLQRLAHDRQVTGTFIEGRGIATRRYRMIDVPIQPNEPHRANDSTPALIRPIDGRPFVPQDPETLDRRCAEVLAIQVAGLTKRVSRLPTSATLAIGVSGGLDSTLALLVAIQACDAAGWPRSRILGLTMPGFGTTSPTLENALTLMRLLGVRSESIDIRQLALDTFAALDHKPLGLAMLPQETVESLQQRLVETADGASDLVFENVQARLRTFLLMTRGFVLGTGDMSEQALGWSTYNGDHMSMYNVNTSIPKTLVKFLVRHVAGLVAEPELRDVLLRVADTPISPELLPPDAQGKIRQSTEAALGAYELHDFFLYHFIRFGATREKIRYLAVHARFEASYTEDQIDAALEMFFKRFFTNQFKRSCVPDGPKVGSVSLSPRGDWRMPSDADSGAF
jgi:NAD+ synthase (glutamine-hydrolysing)